MTQKERIDSLKETITYFYEKEGRSKSYISKVLMVDRKTMSIMMDEWGLVKADSRHLRPSSEKFLNRNRKRILDLLDSDVSITDISSELGIGRKSLLDTYIKNDKELLHHYNLYKKRASDRAADRVQRKTDESSYDYDIATIDGEVWTPILGYNGYEISNMGRIRRYAERYKKFYLVHPSQNVRTGRVYVTLHREGYKPRNLNLARLVAFSFVDGYSDTRSTVDHLDGNFQNNRADNLEWVSQSENNKRAFMNGKKPNVGYQKLGYFKCIILDGKYEFKTIKALSKFLGVSETQARRYILGESKTEHQFVIQY